MGPASTGESCAKLARMGSPRSGAGGEMVAEKEHEESLTRVDGDRWAPRVGACQIVGRAKEA